MKRCKSNHLIYNESINDKIAHLLSLDEKQRPFVASSWYKESASFILSQILYRKKAEAKLPTFVQHHCLYTEKSLSQATSEAVAAFKAGLIAEPGISVISLTGGLGVDDYFMAKVAKGVISLDSDQDLNDLVNYNFECLGAENITRVTAECEEYLNNNKITNQIIYIDPDRRMDNTAKGKVSQYSPNIIDLMPEMIKNGNQVFVKLAGTVDISWIKKEIPFVHSIYIISYRNEVKELLIKCWANSPLALETVSIEIDAAGKAHYFDNWDVLASGLSESETNFLFQPLSCIVKQGVVNKRVEPISPHTNIFYSKDKEVKEFGKLFSISVNELCGFKEISNILADNQFTSASLTARNTRLKSAEMVKKLGLKEDDLKHIFIFGEGKKYRLILAELVP